jgi:hypothetical protein
MNVKRWDRSVKKVTNYRPDTQYVTPSKGMWVGTLSSFHYVLSIKSLKPSFHYLKRALSPWSKYPEEDVQFDSKHSKTASLFFKFSS